MAERSAPAVLHRRHTSRPSGLVVVKVKPLDAKIFCRVWASVKEVKQRLQEGHGVRVAWARLFHNDVELHDTTRLNDLIASQRTGRSLGSKTSSLGTNLFALSSGSASSSSASSSSSRPGASLVFELRVQNPHAMTKDTYMIQWGSSTVEDGEAARRLLAGVQQGLALGLAPQLSLEGTGGTYLMRDALQQPLACFKLATRSRSPEQPARLVWEARPGGDPPAHPVGGERGARGARVPARPPRLRRRPVHLARRSAPPRLQPPAMGLFGALLLRRQGGLAAAVGRARRRRLQLRRLHLPRRRGPQAGRPRPPPPQHRPQRRQRASGRRRRRRRRWAEARPDRPRRLPAAPAAGGVVRLVLARVAAALIAALARAEGLRRLARRRRRGEAVRAPRPPRRRRACLALRDAAAAARRRRRPQPARGGAADVPRGRGARVGAREALGARDAPRPLHAAQPTPRGRTPRALVEQCRAQLGRRRAQRRPALPAAAAAPPAACRPSPASSAASASRPRSRRSRNRCRRSPNRAPTATTTATATAAGRSSPTSWRVGGGRGSLHCTSTGSPRRPCSERRAARRGCRRRRRSAPPPRLPAAASCRPSRSRSATRPPTPPSPRARSDEGTDGDSPPPRPPPVKAADDADANPDAKAEASAGGEAPPAAAAAAAAPLAARSPNSPELGPRAGAATRHSLDLLVPFGPAHAADLRLSHPLCLHESPMPGPRGARARFFALWKGAARARDDELCSPTLLVP